jgi:hypothetical protein
MEDAIYCVRTTDGGAWPVRLLPIKGLHVIILEGGCRRCAGAAEAPAARPTG